MCNIPSSVAKQNRQRDTLGGDTVSLRRMVLVDLVRAEVNKDGLKHRLHQMVVPGLG